jgi:hypothetical protein
LFAANLQKRRSRAALLLSAGADLKRIADQPPAEIPQTRQNLDECMILFW